MQYEKLDIWLRSKNLAIDVYRELAGLRDFGFKDQITRSALEKSRFLVISKGSIGEFKTQTDIGVAIGYINQQRGLYWMNEAEQLSKMLGSFIKRLNNND